MFDEGLHVIYADVHNKTVLSYVWFGYNHNNFYRLWYGYTKCIHRFCVLANGCPLTTITTEYQAIFT